MKNNIVVAYNAKGEELVRFWVEFETADEAYEYVLILQKAVKKARRTKKRDLQGDLYKEIYKIRRYWKRERTAYVDLVV